jgi:uncharacterized protein DUF6476
MAERLDRRLAILKVIVLVMGVLIVLGFAVVVIEITRRLSAMGGEGGEVGDPRTVHIPAGCTAAEMVALGDRLAVRLEPAAACPDLLLLDADGREVGRVELAPSGP